MNEIYNMIKEVFPNTKILLIYYGGSKAYGLDDENSDIDLTVVLDGFKGILHLFIGNYDLFVFSKEDFIKRQQFDDSIIAYHRQAADNIMGIDSNEYYLSPEFSNELNELIKSVDRSFIYHFIDAVLVYAISKFEINPTSKTHYHLFRLRGMLDHYDETGQFNLKVSEPWYSLMLEYKANYKTHDATKYVDKIIEQIDYLSNYRKEMKNHGLG
ncbi:hypothetical protein BK011_07150 [Tenericutes bacterium MZ-XQ]|jgi:hypothetical protein|nr:hypothetical protein BK011_07150 [Tenericutes bacterium MZ-XQ]